jgi:hypothetical protein
LNLDPLAKRVPLIGRSALCAPTREQAHLQTELGATRHLVNFIAEGRSILVIQTRQNRSLTRHRVPFVRPALAGVFQFNGTESGQIIRRGTRTGLVRVYCGRDVETKKRKYPNQTIHGGLRDAQAHLNKMLSERDCGRKLDSSKQTLNQ